MKEAFEYVAKCYLFIDKFFHGRTNSIICMNRILITYEAVEIPAEFRELPVVWNCGLWIFLLGTGEDSAVVECCGYFCVLPCLGSFVWSVVFVEWKKSFINYISILLYNISMTLNGRVDILLGSNLPRNLSWSNHR